MTDAVTFYRLYVSTINQCINTLDDLRTQNDRLAQEAGLPAAAADAASKSGRPDLTTQAFTDAKNAIDQVLFAFDSGAPPQKAAMYKML